MDKIIKTINNGHKVFDIDDVVRIVSLFVDWYDLGNFYKGIGFKSKGHYTAIYNLKTEKLSFNDKQIIRGAYNLYDSVYNVYHVDENSYNYFLNAYYLYTICHEIDHICQKKKAVQASNENYQSFMFETNNLLKKNRGAYRDYHNIFPMEKKSINTGGLVAYNIMNQTNIPDRELDVLYLVYLIRRLEDYHLEKDNQIISPINQFFSLDTSKEYQKKMNQLLVTANLTLDDRLDYGLDISYDEYMLVKEKKHQLYKIINNKKR